MPQATAAKDMPRRDTPPLQRWRSFLANHVGQIMAADFFVVPTVTYRLLFVLVILAHDRRRIVPPPSPTIPRPHGRPNNSAAITFVLFEAMTNLT